MDIRKVVADLREERERLDQVIVALERLSQARTPRRGRPPGAWSRATGLTAVQRGNGLNGSARHAVANV